MPGFRLKLNFRFESVGKFVIRYRWAFIVFHLCLCGLLLSELPKLRIVTTVESLFYPQDKTLKEYHEFRDQFGRGDTIVLLIKSSDIFTVHFLTHLKQFHADLKDSVPFLTQISSLTNARYLYAEHGQTVAQDFLDDLPASSEEALALKSLAVKYPSFQGVYFTEDLRHAVVTLKTEAVSRLSNDGKRISTLNLPERPLSISQIENSAIIGVVKAVMQEYEAEEFQISLSGTPVYQSYVEPLLKSGMKNLSILVLVLTAVFMSILFGRVSGVFLPQFIVVFGLIITLGVMSLNGASLTSTTSMLPAFLLSVGLTAPIHFLVVFFKFQNDEDRLTAIVSTFGHSGLPIAMTSVTTAAGFLSFSFTEIAPVADLGIYSALGVMICLGLTLFFLPALIAVLDIRSGKAREKKYEQSAYNRLLMGMGRFGVEHPYKMVLITLGITLFLSSGITKVNFSHHMLDYLLDNSEFKKTLKLIEKETKGFRSLEVVVDTGIKNGVLNRDLFHGLEELERYVLAQRNGAGDPVVGKTYSLLNIVKEVNQVTHENQPAQYKIPADNADIAKHLEFLKKSRPDDLNKYTDSKFSKARFSVKMYWNDATDDVGFVNRLEKVVRKLFGKNSNVILTGEVTLGSRTFNSMLDSLSMSYLVAMLTITLLMILLIGDLKMGLIAMIPNLLPVIVGVGIMGLLDIPLNTFNLIAGSVVIGLAVDDTIHFFHNFQAYYAQTADVKTAVEKTLGSTGRALLTTTLILVSSFWLRLFNPLKVIGDSGLIMGISLMIAFLADVALAPALLKLMLEPKFSRITVTRKLQP